MILNEVIISQVEDDEEVLEKYSFFEQDIISICSELGIDAPIYRLSDYETKSTAEYKELISKFMSGIDLKNSIVIAESYIRDHELPDVETPDELRIETDKIISAYANILESLGFIDLNFFVKTKYSIPFIYKNDITDKIYKSMQRCEFD